MGLRGRARRLGRRARALGDHVHRVRPGGPGGLPRDDGGLQDGRALRDRPAARRTRTPRSCPYRIDGRWVLLHRPKTEFGGARGEILLSRSTDLTSWSAPEQVLQPRAGAWWDSRPHRHRPAAASHRARLAARLPRRQADRVPATSTASASRCSTSTSRRACCTACPSGSSARSQPYERVGDVPNVVFPCGLVHDPVTDEVRLYYGAADSSICLATAQLDRPARRRARRAGRLTPGGHAATQLASLGSHLVPDTTTCPARPLLVSDTKRQPSGHVRAVRHVAAGHLASPALVA